MEHRAELFNVVQLINKNRATRLEALDDKAIVDDFVAHVDRRAELIERILDNLNRAIHAGAEPARVR